MAIPEAQLKTWSNDGATVMAEETHSRIRRVLLAHTWPTEMTPTLYLQGSYRNSTTVRADSDVDLVCEATSVFYSIKNDAFTPSQLERFKRTHSDGAFGWTRFHEQVLKALRKGYGDSVRPKTNAIKVAAGAGRLAADVVVSVTYKQFIPDATASVPAYFHQGIAFFADSKRQVVNFPKQHYENGAAKNSSDRTRGQFKPMVRVFKNARRRMVQDGMLARGVAPSYFIQCLLYNVPDSLFIGSYWEAYVAIVNWLAKANLQSFVCQNGITSLFGTTPTHWDIGSADDYVSGLIDLWNDWS